MMRFVQFALILVAGICNAQESVANIPSWLTQEKLKAIEKIGINTKTDIKTKGKYHYGYVASSELKFGGYSCPIGTVVDVSRSIILVRSTDPKSCHDKDSRPFRALKLDVDGSVTPL